MKENPKTPVDIIVPQATIFSEHPAVVIDRNVTADKRAAVDAFINYLSSEEAQRAFVKYHFRAVADDSLNKENKQLADIQMPFTIDYFGGWAKAYPEIIEGIFRDQVQRK
jgi:ABC-type sulfate transport system substrate-binding protein